LQFCILTFCSELSEFSSELLISASSCWSDSSSEASAVSSDFSGSTCLILLASAITLFKFFITCLTTSRNFS
jgi:hypothetical protein